MSDKKYIQPQRFQTTLPKNQAISRVEEYINEHIDEFKNGEEIVFEYKKEWVENGELKSKTIETNAVVIINGEESHLFASVSDDDTLKIVESEAEPQDKSALWLTEITNEDVSGETSNLREEIKLLKNTVKVLLNLVSKHEYALNNTLAGGDIIVNSEKFDLENKYEREKPEDAEDPTPWAENDFIITNFETFIANSPLTEFINSDGLYKGQRYPLNYKFYNAEGERVPDEYSTVFVSVEPLTVATYVNGALYATTSGQCDVHITVNSEGGSLITEHYVGVRFGYNEEPYYPLYEEPNVHHQLIKHSDSEEIMTQNSDLLLVGEFCWCIKENSLYLKEKASNGTIQLFKINGGGSITPTSSVTITYYVDEYGILNAYASDDSIYVDEDGILNLVGEVDENGTLILNPSSGYTPTPPTPSGETVTVKINSNGILSIDSSDGSAHVSQNGILTLPSPIMVDNNGILLL